MAEIEIERRPRRGGWTWLALAIILAAVALGAWLLTRTDDPAVDVPAATEPAPDPVVEPVTPPAQELQPTVPRTEDADAAPERQPGATTDRPVDQRPTPGSNDVIAARAPAALAAAAVTGPVRRSG